MFVVDFGKSSAHYTHAGANGVITHEAFLNAQLPGIKAGDVLIVEDAHMRPRNSHSLAQPFEYEQLVRIKQTYADLGVEIKVFPQKVTPLARTLYGADDKNDLNDILSIEAYLSLSPRAYAALKTFNPVRYEEFQQGNSHKWADRTQLTNDVNLARNLEYKGDAASKWVEDNIVELYSLLDEDARKLLDMRIVNKGKVNERVGYNVSRLVTVVLTILKPNGELRLRSDIGKPAYWKYAKEVYFGMTPYHMSAGVTASNVKHHWRRASSSFRKTTKADPIRISELEEFRSARSEFDKTLRTIWRTIRQMILSTNNNGC